MRKDYELAQLRDRVAALEAENAELRAAAPEPDPEDDWAVSNDEWEESARHWSDDGWDSSSC